MAEAILLMLTTLEIYSRIALNSQARNLKNLRLKRRLFISLEILDTLEDFVFQVENKDSKKNNDMYYLRFTKVIVDYFMAKDPSISKRNKMFWHTARHDSMFTTIRVISKHQDTQIYDQDTLSSKGKRIKTSAKGDKPAKKKQPVQKSKSLTVLFEVALTKAEQVELATKRSLTQTHSSHASGSGDGVDTQSKEESWTFSQGDDDDDDDADKECDANDDSEESEEDDDGDDFVHPKLSTYIEDVQDEEEYDTEERAKDDEDLSDQREGEKEYDDEEMLYGDLNLNLERRDADMTEDQTTKITKEDHVNLTNVAPVVLQQSSSVSSDLVSKYINPLIDTPSLITTTSQPPISITQTLLQTPDPTSTTTLPTTMMPEIPNFASLFGFDQRVSAFESELSMIKQSNPFAEAVSSISSIVDGYLASKLKEAVDVVVQLKSDKLREEAQAKN
ncbi:hypothetical protein Tco_1145682 [Tanacetum coccineum]